MNWIRNSMLISHISFMCNWCPDYNEINPKSFFFLCTNKESRCAEKTGARNGWTSQFYQNPSMHFEHSHKDKDATNKSMYISIEEKHWQIDNQYVLLQIVNTHMHKGCLSIVIMFVSPKKRKHFKLVKHARLIRSVYQKERQNHDSLGIPMC